MPLIHVRVSNDNIDNSDVLLKELSAELSRLTGKPEKYVMTSLQTDVLMTFAGTNAPCCFVEIKSIGAIRPGEMAYSFCELIASKTNIPSDRIYIQFEDIPASLWGWNGKTFG